MIKNSICLSISFVLVLAVGDVLAQETVYKWTDEDGVVHFGEAPPPGVEAETITTDAAPPAPPPRTTAPRENQAAETAEPPAEPAPASVPIAEPTPVSDMSLAELDARCDRAREAKIAPLREAEIEKCKADSRNDPNFCDTFYADYGDGGRTKTGAIRPRMFDNLPECVEALNERNSRPN